ncbi:unnamed protein product [Paramecium octaurelia]|uniref:Uncharacterized protein n=1 Tax=Paramecium octaurelia TaxID=43137 RepID=A0A8S1WLZ8_PAROT|nr:unnamed protein product [Paramecium octaurelia]
MTLCRILLFLNCFLLVFTDQNCNYLSNQELKIKSILRGQYKDVASDSNGAIVSSARQIVFVGIVQYSSPLRDPIYAVQHDREHIDTYTLIEVLFAQTYELNQIIVWFYDLDNRNFYFQLIVKNRENIEKVVFLGQRVQGIVKVNFSDQMVSSIKLIYMPGGTVNELTVIKIQAYYANRASP